MIEFYAPDIEETLTLPESDSAHCVRVLRMNVGDPLRVVDGRGTRFECQLSVAHPKRAMVEIISRQRVEPVWTNNITIAVAPTKNMDRMEWLVEKLVEVGVNRIIPIKCRHSERREIKTERLVKIAVSAMKQSLKATLPEIWDMTPIDKMVEAIQAPQKFIGYCDDQVERKLFSKEYKANTDVVIMIGPEGDFSPEEIAMTLQAGYVPVTMGDNRLRTETAALVACDTCQIINQLG